MVDGEENEHRREGRQAKLHTHTFCATIVPAAPLYRPSATGQAALGQQKQTGMDVRTDTCHGA